MRKQRTTYSIGPLTHLRMREIMREELDIHAAFGFSKYLAQGVDSHFDGRKAFEAAPPPDEEWLKPSDQWNSEEIVCPSTLYTVSIYSKMAWNYGYACFRTELPNLVNNNQEVWLGFENDAGIGTGIAAFHWHKPAGVERLAAVIGGQFDYADIAITAALPTDFKTAKHAYGVKVNKGTVEFYIDNSLVAVGINSPNLVAHPYITYPPYALFRANVGSSRSMMSLIEVVGAKTRLALTLKPDGVRLCHDDPLPPRLWDLYQSASSNKMRGASIGSGSLSSHPIPIFGYDKATFMFRADQAGDLDIEVLPQSGTWRTYDTISTVADTLESYIMEGGAILARLTFTPLAYPATVAEAEAVVK